jgi:hypothetical protein
MEFVKVYDTAVLTSNDVLKEIGHFNDCGADNINIEYLDRKTRVTITASDTHTFLACAAKYVDEHTLDAWTEQASMHGNMRTYTGRNRPGGHGTPDFKQGHYSYKIKLSQIEKELRKVFKLGYGGTIHLTINGESYEVIDD